MVNILLTGRSGYIASSLLLYLKDKYNITAVGRADLDLTNKSEVKKWISDKHFDVVIHTAIQGGHRSVTDNNSIFDNNIKIYYNLLDIKQNYVKLINIGSGAEIHNLHTLYGYSKHIIRNSVLEQNNFYNIRAYGIFDENELASRFIKSNIIRYINKQPMVIHRDKKMDFFYMSDFVSLLEYYIHNNDVPKEIDCSYAHTYYLSEILKKINMLGDYSVPIEYHSMDIEEDYKGKYTDLNIPYIGIDKGIQHTYRSLCNR